MRVVGPKASQRHLSKNAPSGVRGPRAAPGANREPPDRDARAARDAMIASARAPTAPTDGHAMHRYAGHDAKKLARALQNIQRGGQPIADVGLANAWGNTLLHTACASVGASRQVALLLDAGADVRAVGPYGLTPLAAALNARQWKSADLVAAAGGHAAQGLFNEASERSLLANIFGIDGITTLHGQVFELEGAFDFGVYPRLAAAVEAFARTEADPSFISPTFWAQSAQALREAPRQTYVSGRALKACVRAGTPMLLSTGWRGHSVCIALLDNFAVRANRNQSHAWSAYKSLQPWHFPKGFVRGDQLQCLVDNRGRAPWLGKAVLVWGDATHRLSRHHPVAHTCAQVAPKAQKAHNCTVANAKAGLLGLLILLRARAGVRETAATRARLQREYKRLTTFIRLYFLERYRALHVHPGPTHTDPPDTSLVQRCEAKLRASDSRRFCLARMRQTCASEAHRC